MKKSESAKQKISREINQTNFVLHGIRKNLQTHHKKLLRLGLVVASFKLSMAIDSVNDSIDYIALERKQDR